MTELDILPRNMALTTLVPALDNATSHLDAIDDLIHPYWKQFDLEAIPESWSYGVGLWVSVFGVLGIFGNLLVLTTFLRAKSLRTPPNMLLVNLAISDMAFSAINGFPFFTISSLNRRWVYGDAWCQAYAAIAGYFGFVSISTLAWVSYDRYVVISNPLEAAQKVTKKRALVMIFISHILSLLWTIPPFFGFGGYIPEGFQVSCTFDYLTHTTKNYAHNFLMYVFGFFLPVFVIICAYTGIVRALVKHHGEMDAQAKKMGAKNASGDVARRQELQATKVAATSITAFLLSWTPYAIVAYYGLTKAHEEMYVTPLLAMIPVMFAKSAAFWNPIIYALGHPKFRAEIDKHYPWLLACCKPPPQSYPSASTKSKGSTKSESSVTDTVEMSRAPSVSEGVANPTA